MPLFFHPCPPSLAYDRQVTKSQSGYAAPYYGGSVTSGRFRPQVIPYFRSNPLLPPYPHDGVFRLLPVLSSPTWKASTMALPVRRS
jgi:hypothetical protein